MNAISTGVKSSLPNYLSGLPVPDTFGGWFKLSFRDWLSLIPPTAVVAGIGYLTYKTIYSSQERCSGGKHCNTDIRKGEPKVVDTVDIENIADKAAFCRCWKSRNWPYCDGSHAAHNSLTGDNVGPIVMVRKK